MVTDGPFGAAAEQLTRYVLVDCESVEGATAIAARLPGTGSGAAEVRPVMDPSGQEM